MGKLYDIFNILVQVGPALYYKPQVNHVTKTIPFHFHFLKPKVRKQVFLPPSSHPRLVLHLPTFTINHLNSHAIKNS
jgi:hypothetical protein